MRKEITFYVFLGEKRDPSEIYANPNLRNLTHITQKPSYVYTFLTYTLKEITALPSPTRINSSVRPSVCLSVCLSVHTCRLGVQRKMAQAQQIRSIILQNHESTM
jgi:hypothetical protein